MIHFDRVVLEQELAELTETFRKREELLQQSIIEVKSHEYDQMRSSAPQNTSFLFMWYEWAYAHIMPGFLCAFFCGRCAAFNNLIIYFNTGENGKP